MTKKKHIKLFRKAELVVMVNKNITTLSKALSKVTTICFCKASVSDPEPAI